MKGIRNELAEVAEEADTATMFEINFHRYMDRKSLKEYGPNTSKGN